MSRGLTRSLTLSGHVRDVSEFELDTVRADATRASASESSDQQQPAWPGNAMDGTH